ncbi:MAG: aquaporin [Lysobacter sp.]|nr:aquaporin [Lysobacter sp.]
MTSAGSRHQDATPARAASRALAAEFLGTAALLAIVVGSGIMGERLAQGNDAIALLAKAAATAGGLYVLIVALGPLSGAHFNPVVSAAMRLRGERLPAPLFAYIATQAIAAIVGVAVAHAMFGEALWQPGDHVRTGAAQWFSEAVATFGLLTTILFGVRHRPQAVPALVGAYIFAAYWFTPSTSFANPAVTLARAFTQTFAGIRFADVGGFVLAQCAGALAAIAFARALIEPDQNAKQA